MNHRALRWIALTLPLAALAALVYVFAEWLFIVTKPSPTASLPFATEIAVLVAAPLPLLLPLLGVQAIASLLSAIAYPRLRGLAVVPAAVIAGALLFLMVDNFTYTLSGVGVVTSGPAFRAAYAALLMVLIAVAGWKVSRWLDAIVGRRGAPTLGLVFAALLAAAPATVAWATAVPTPDLAEPPRSASAGSGGKLPNILFLGIDGVDDPILSVYGYSRETTPFLESIQSETLLFENAFSNVGHTHGSIVALLSGRLPFSTKVTFPPTVLQGEDSRRHLPGILKRLGYTTLQIGMRHYVDAEDANMLGAFDAANYRWQDLEDVQAAEKTADETDGFRAVLAERLDERIGQIFGFGTVANGFAHVTGQQQEPMWKDERRIETLVRYLPVAQEPWFVHLHLLDTHCCNYGPDQMYFSGGDSVTRDKRDSEIRETDANVRKLFDMLKASGRLDRTIIVISSDHTSQWTTTGRVPLIMRFPGAARTGRVTENVQLADVAPTMLDYLGVEVPSWMDGVSLLGPVPADRRVFAVADITERQGNATNRLLLKSGPPNYGTRSVSMIAGNQWFELSLLDGSLQSGGVEGHTLGNAESMAAEKAQALIIDQVRAAGFQIGEPVTK